MSIFTNYKSHECNQALRYVILSGVVLGLGACNEPETTTPMMKTYSAATCQGNDDGWYCYTNPELNVAAGDEFYDTDLIHCVGDSVSEVKLCQDECDVRSAGMNDVCTTGSSASTCQDNDDGWYCYTNPELNVAAGDEFYDTDLIHCVGDSVSEVKVCTEGCEVKSQGLNDVCASGTTTPVCGNGLIEGTEVCDLLNLNGQTCSGAGHDGGTLTCSALCQLDSNSCCDHSCTGDTQCIGTTKQTCQDSNNDGCNEWVNTGTCPPNPVCGNGNIEGTEVCDASNMNGHTCESEGYDGGTATCTGSCTVNSGACCNDSCTSGTQCENDIEQTCQDGDNDGCNEWVNTGSCAPTCTTTIASNSCYSYTSSAGGAYEIFEICAEVVGTDRIKIYVRKNPSSDFGYRPYGAKVFGLSDAECSHSTHYYNEANSSVVVAGQGTSQLTLEFNVTWAGTQTDKRYCAYASTQSSDPYFDDNNDEQLIWWYSRSLHVKKVCN
jgi:hypothetical protein